MCLTSYATQCGLLRNFKAGHTWSEKEKTSPMVPSSCHTIPCILLGLQSSLLAPLDGKAPTCAH